MKHERTRFISLNGPDNVGKTTQLRLLTHDPRYHLLGSVHHHDPEPWEKASRFGYARWWFQEVPIDRLYTLFARGHTRRAVSLPLNHVGLLDRGWPMLVAVTAATLAVREGRGPLDAYEVIRSLDSASSLEGPEETAVLLLPSFDTERSLLLGQTRDQHTWTGLYPEYQRALHEILLHQAEQGTYTHVLDCEGQDVKSTHAHIRSVLEQIMHFTAEEPS